MKMLVVGLTGSIVSGKTTVARIMKELGAEVIDADRIARDIVRPHEKAWKQIVDCFGEEILNGNQEINRKELGRIAFSNPEKLQLLNQITHPEIIASIKKKIRQFRKWSERDIICVIDAPLLFEARMERLMDRVIVVYLTREKQVKRLHLRDGLTGEEATKRIASQMPIEEKVKLADYVIDNCQTYEKTEEQVFQVWSELQKILADLP